MTYTPEYTNPNPLANPTAPDPPKKDPSMLQILPVVTGAAATAPIPLADPIDPATLGVVESVNDLLMVALPMLFPGIGLAGVAVDAALMKLVPYLVAVLQKKNFDLATLRAMQTDLNTFGPSFPNQPGYANIGAVTVPGVVTPPAAGSGSTVPVSMTVKIGNSLITLTADSFESLLSSLVKLGSAVSSSPTSPILTPAGPPVVLPTPVA